MGRAWRGVAAAREAVASPCYNVLAKIFGEVGCPRIVSFWLDQGTGVDPTEPRSLTLTLTLTLTLALAPILTRTQSGPETSQKQGCAAFASNEKTPGVVPTQPLS